MQNLGLMNPHFSLALGSASGRDKLKQTEISTNPDVITSKLKNLDVTEQNLEVMQYAYK